MAWFLVKRTQVGKYTGEIRIHMLSCLRVYMFTFSVLFYSVLIKFILFQGCGPDGAECGQPLSQRSLGFGLPLRILLLLLHAGSGKVSLCQVGLG